MKGKVRFSLIAMLLLVFLLGGIVGYLVGSGKVSSNGVKLVPPRTGCTLEAKICPDGSGVGRTGPNCEFAPCP